MSTVSQSSTSINFLAILAGLLVGVVLVVAAVLLFVRKSQSAQYDERQLLARNAAYKSAFFVVLGVVVACLILDIFELRWAQTAVQMMLVMAAGVATFVLVSLHKDAYFGYNRQSRPAGFVVIAYVVAACNALPFALNLAAGEAFLTDGMLNYHCINAIIGALFLVVAVACTVKLIKAKKEENE